MPSATVRRVQAPSRPARPAGTATLLALLALLGVVVLGGRLLAAALLLRDGRPLRVAPAVRLRPLPGWHLASAQAGTRPGLLTRGSANLAVLATGPRGSADQLAGWYLEHELRPRASATIVWRPLGPVRAAGRVGAGFGYRGEFAGPDRAGPVSGEVVVLAGGVAAGSGAPAGYGGAAGGIVFDAWAPPDVYPYERRDARTMLARAQVGR